MKNKNPTEKAMETIKKYNTQKIKSDVDGSYTGFPIGEDEPIQDVDDL